MKLLVTGASGFLGQAVVSEALARGHSVRAMVRTGTDVSGLPWYGAAHLEYARVDLRSRKGLDAALAGVDAVLHLAASLAGDFYTQFEGTVIATERLMEAVRAAGGKRLVLISSFSVYGYLRRWSFTRMDEGSPLEEVMDERDEYAKTKLLQEKLVREYAAEGGWPLAVLRPGVIYGPEKVFGARLGLRVNNRIWLRLGAWARVPVTYVENCAQAVVLATETDEAYGQTLNILDDDPPSQHALAMAIQNRTSPRPILVPICWTLLRVTARASWIFNRVFLGGRAKVPGILVPARLHARFKPLRYSNAKIHRILNWQPRFTLAQALDRSCMDSKSEI
jgi:nucleoside-diphosphate-sugar epimerase